MGEIEKPGFTLAEILITLSIIGVVAALTIPSLVADYKEKEMVTRTQKAFNTLSNAFALAKVQYGEPSTWGGTGYSNGYSLQGAINVMDKLTPFMNLVKRCDGTKGCWAPNVTYKFLDGREYNINDNRDEIAKALLADSMSIWLHPYSESCTNNIGAGKLERNCGDIHIDVNGFKGPNVYGKDSFAFYYTQEGIVPYGTPTEKDSNYPLHKGCRGATGWGCTAWVILKGNMDYPPQGQGWD